MLLSEAVGLLNRTCEVALALLVMLLIRLPLLGLAGSNTSLATFAMAGNALYWSPSRYTTTRSSNLRPAMRCWRLCSAACCWAVVPAWRGARDFRAFKVVQFSWIWEPPELRHTLFCS